MAKGRTAKPMQSNSTMAKKKNNNKNGQQVRLSPERFMREKARTLPIGKCYITPGREESGMARIIVTRVRPSGNLTVGIFLTDIFCTGVREAAWDSNVPSDEFENLIQKYDRGSGFEEISYNEAHNIIYGAIGFAEDGGIKPAKDFNIAGFVLEEDTDDIPYIEYQFGKNGRHFITVSRDRREMPFLRTLRDNLGVDFDYIIEGEDESASVFPEDGMQRAISNMKRRMEESKRHPDEPFSYRYPKYPKTIRVKKRFIADAILSTDNIASLPRETIERILSLAPDEAAADISKVVFYEIGRTYKEINDETIGPSDESAIIHSLLLLSALGSEKGLKAVLEIMSQNREFIEFHLGDLAFEFITPALYACGKDNIPALESYLVKTGHDSYLRSQASDALVMTATLHPERRNEIIEVYRRILTSMATRLPKLKGCDGKFAGFLMLDLIDLKANELISEIKAVYATDCVDKSICGDYEKVISEIKNENCTDNRDKYRVSDIYEKYDYMARFTD